MPCPQCLHLHPGRRKMLLKLHRGSCTVISNKQGLCLIGQALVLWLMVRTFVSPMAQGHACPRTPDLAAWRRTSADKAGVRRASRKGVVADSALSGDSCWGRADQHTDTLMKLSISACLLCARHGEVQETQRGKRQTSFFPHAHSPGKKTRAQRCD